MSNVKPKDLPTWLQKVIQIRTEDDGQVYDDNERLVAMFHFDKTPEGFQYWRDIADGTLPTQPLPNQLMTQQLIIKDAEDIVYINNFKYDKDTKIFTINHKDLLKITSRVESEIPQRIVVHNPKTYGTKTFKIDIALLEKQVIVIPQQQNKPYTINYFSPQKDGCYYLDVIIPRQ